MRDGGQSAPEAEPPTLALPKVPAELATVEERAAYVARHFYDSLDFRSPLAVDTAFVEQNFVNFAAILPAVKEADAAAAAGELLERAHASAPAYSLLVATIERYLDDPNSPMRNEDFYIIFLRAQAQAPWLSAAERERPAALLESALKNRPGDTAADLRLALRGGGRSTLHELCRRAEQTMLIFYDPDCEHCREVMGRLASLELPQGMQVVAVDAEGDLPRWQATCGALPQAWTVAYAEGDPLGEGLYEVKATPCVYVLDASATVLAKDARLSL